MMPKRTPQRRWQRDRFEIFRAGLDLLRWLATEPVSRADAAEAGINYREWHRWLKTFERAGVELRKSQDADGRVYYRITKAQWRELVR